MLNENAVMQYNRELSDNTTEVLKNIWLLLLPDNELQSLQSEYNTLPEDTISEQDIKRAHKGKNILYDEGVYKVVFDMHSIGRDKKTQVSLPAYYSILSNRDRFGNQTINPTVTDTNTITIDSELISLADNTITINNTATDSVNNLEYKNMQQHVYTRDRKSFESDIDEIFSFIYAPIGSYPYDSNNRIVMRDLFTDTTDYFNTYFRDYFYTNFAEDYMMEMSYEHIVPNFTKGLLFNRQFYAYAKGGNFFFTQFSNSELLSYGSKMWWTGDHFVFKKGVEGSIDNDKAGRYFSFQYSTGEEGNNPSNPFLNIHRKGEYLGTRGGEVCTTISNNKVVDFELDRDLVFMGDYFKEVDVMINNKLYFGDMSNWTIIGGVRNSPASIYYDDDKSELMFRTPSDSFIYLFGSEFENTSQLKMKYINDTSGEFINFKSYSKEDGARIPIIVDGEFDPETNTVPRFTKHCIPEHTKTMLKTSSFDIGLVDGVYQNSVACVSDWATNEETGSTQVFSIYLPTNPIENEVVTIWILKDLNQDITQNTVRVEIPNDDDSWIVLTETTTYIYTTNGWRLVE